jgi:hypothetical protein
MEGWGVAQVVEHLPTKFKNLGSTHGTNEKKIFTLTSNV